MKIKCIHNNYWPPSLVEFNNTTRRNVDLTIGKTYEVIRRAGITHGDFIVINDIGNEQHYSEDRFEVVKEITIEELEQKIKEVEQTIDDVKNFKNLKRGSRLINTLYDEEYIVAFVGFYVMVNVYYGNWWNDNTISLQDVKDNMKEYSDRFTLVGDPLISDLEKELEDLNNKLEELTKPKTLKCSDAPDGWYVLSGRTYGEFTLPYIQKNDVIFIKDGKVFMKDHGRFTSTNAQKNYCIEGVDKFCWSYLVEKLP